MQFLLIGADRRQDFLYDMLKKHDCHVIYVKELTDGQIENLPQCDVVLLPVSKSSMYFEKIITKLKGNETVFGCNLKTEEWNNVHPTGAFQCIEYMKGDATAYQNAIATAEGCIVEMVVHSNRNIHGSQCLITGFGRCAQVLAAKLKGMDAKVTIMARNAVQRSYAEACGYEALDFLEEKAKNWNTFHYIINTVPAEVITEKQIQTIQPETLMVDIASKPGVKQNYCENNNIKYIHALGLPGKYAPETSAKILYQVIAEKLQLE